MKINEDVPRNACDSCGDPIPPGGERFINIHGTSVTACDACVGAVSKLLTVDESKATWLPIKAAFVKAEAEKALADTALAESAAALEP